MRAFTAPRGRHSAGSRNRSSRRLPRFLKYAVLGGVALASLGPAFGSESFTYSYDARGRLVKVARSGTVNNGTSECYNYDKADNRQYVTVTTSSDCAAGVTFSVSDASVSEGGTLVFTITKSGTASGTTTVNYATADSSAVAGSDYTAASGTLTFLATDTSKTVIVATTDDAVRESAETMLLNLSNATGGATIIDGQGTGTIVDNDTFACSSVSFTVAGNGPVTEGVVSSFTITKAGTATGNCSVNYATANGTAVAPGDYAAASGTLTFTPSQAVQTVNVATVDDSIAEGDETFNLNLSSPTSPATLGTPSSATATINNDTDVRFTISDNSDPEGSIIFFSVHKVGSTSATITVNYATADDTAIAPGDYTATSGTLTFAPTDILKQISVSTRDDGLIEGDETFFVNLSGASSGTITDNQAVGTINDNDGGCGSGCLISNGAPPTTDSTATSPDGTSVPSDPNSVPPDSSSTATDPPPPPPDPATSTDPQSPGE